MMAKAFALSFFAAAALVSSASAAPFTNGSFESGPAVPNEPGFTMLLDGSAAIEAWTVIGQLCNGGVDIKGPKDVGNDFNRAWTAQDGTFSLDLNGDSAGGVSQIFDTVVGKAYKVSFYMASNPYDPSLSLKSLTASIASGATALSYLATFQQTAANTPTDMGWVLHSFSFVANDSSTTLSFLSNNLGKNNFFGPTLDNVTVTAVPLPTAFPLLLGALATLGVLHRTRRRRPAA